MARQRFSDGLFDIDPILNVLAISPGQTVVDAGCGNGYMTKVFAELVGPTGRVYAVDVEQAFIDDFKEEIKTANVTTVIGDVTVGLDLPDNSVDLVYLSAVFHIFSRQGEIGFDREVGRILKPGANLAVLNIKKEVTSFGPPVEAKSSPEELRRKLSLIPGKYIEVDRYFYMQVFEKE